MCLILGLLSLLLIAAAAWLAVVERGRSRRALYERMRGVGCNAPEQLGLSVLLTECRSLHQIEALLTVEYARYEVVTVVDGEADAPLFTRLCRRYHLIRVEYRPTGDLPTAGVRGLYRSRKRRFRRLVLLDMEPFARTVRLNGAADVASYEYLWLLPHGVRPLRGAVERLICRLGSMEGSCPLLRCVLGRRSCIYDRQHVVEAGGFGALRGVRELWRGRWLDERLLAPLVQRQHGAGWGWLSVLLPAAIALIGWSRQWLLPAACAATLLILRLVVLRTRQLTRDE